MATSFPANTEPKCMGPRMPAVDRALNLLELLSNSQNGLTLSELSRKLGIPKSTAHYLINTLATRGYIQHASDGRHYSLGLRLSDIAASNRARDELSAVTMPHLHDAARRTGLTAIATVLLGAEGLIIGKVGCPNDPGGGAWVGRHIDLHCTAQGKALIAYLPEPRLLDIFRGRELAQFTAKTICSFASLRAHLAAVREQGFAVNDEEHVVGVRAVGAPVSDSCGSVVAAISVRGSTRDIPSHRIEQLGFEMTRIADRITRELRGSRCERPFLSRS